MNYSKIIPCDLLNGPGCRVSLWVNGCVLNCVGCHGKELQNFRSGLPFTEATEQEIIKLCDNPFISGLSILGGDPLAHQNTKAVRSLLESFRCYFNNTKNVWCWTGYTLEELQERGCEDTYAILYLIDTLIDGRFVEALKSPSLQYRGSSNQRVLHKYKDFYHAGLISI